MRGKPLRESEKIFIEVVNNKVVKKWRFFVQKKLKRENSFERFLSQPFLIKL